MTESDETETKPNLKVLPSEGEPSEADLDEIEDGEDDEDVDDGVNVYTVFLKDNPSPMPAIDDRDYVDLVTDFGQHLKDGTPFFAFNGDPTENFIGSALVRVESIAAIQQLVTAEELEDYLGDRTDEDEEGETEEDEAVAEHNRQVEARKAAKRAAKEAEAARVKPGNKGPKGGKKGARGLV